MIASRLPAAYEKVRQQLLDERLPAGHWEGRLASSALSTATAISALSLVRRHAQSAEMRGQEAEITRWVEAGVAWLLGVQNEDGGWGDTDRSYSNIAASMLARAALHLAGVAEQHQAPLKRVEEYLQEQGGLAGLKRRYGKDKTFAAPILTNCALAGWESWDKGSPLPL